MSVNKTITQENFAQTVAAVWPVHIEPDSLADKLLKKDREEGWERGRRGELTKAIGFYQSILAIDESQQTEFDKLSLYELDQFATDLQRQVRERTA